MLCLGALLAADDAASSVDALIEAGHWKRARQVALSRAAANPNDAQAHDWLCKTAIGFGNLDTAVHEGERAVEIDGGNATFHGHLAEAYALTADKSTVFKGLIYVRKMRKEADAALAIDPRHIDTMLLEMVFSFRAPAVAGGDKQKSHRLADQILSLSPVWGYLAQARLSELAGLVGPDTETALKKAVQADPSFYRARASLAAYYCGERTCVAPAGAERAAQEAITVDPGAAPAYEVLARVYVIEKRWADLDALLSRAEKAVPDDLGPYYSAADRLIESGQDFNRAERYLQRYLSQAPEGKEPTLAEARRLLAEMYERAGRKNDALRELELAHRMQPDYEPAKKDLDRLRHL